ncbi:hypothetical protein GS575_09395 [Rhodococcus hoagii]|nr:hypothetical protein [Prescottella equi]
MTETITPASLRAHADWLLATHGDSERLAGQLRSAANKLEIRLEAESARDEEAERLAKVHHEAGYIAEWDALHPETRDGLVAQMRAVLDRLAADGRLLPEGGTAGMSRMQAEFARASARMERLPDEYRPVVTPPAASVPLELPTEPGSRIRASVKRWGSAREWADTDPYVDTFTLGERDIWHAENDCLVVGAWNREYITVLEVLPAVSVPDGGPDGTPEKPWPNLHEVPTSVRKVSDAFGCHWERRQDSGWNRCIGAPQCAAGHPDLAPFVRVDGDKA